MSFPTFSGENKLDIIKQNKERHRLNPSIFIYRFIVNLLAMKFDP
jgi:hypothetical protein